MDPEHGAGIEVRPEENVLTVLPPRERSQASPMKRVGRTDLPAQFGFKLGRFAADNRFPSIRKFHVALPG